MSKGEFGKGAAGGGGGGALQGKFHGVMYFMSIIPAIFNGCNLDTSVIAV